MPDPKAGDPHTPIFDPAGTLWFTVQIGNMIGKLVPKTGEVKLAPVPTADASPYGIVVNSKGIPIFCEFNTNKLASIDPKTMQITEYTLPNPGTRPRRIAVMGDEVWYTDHTRGYLGRYNLRTGEAREWLSPGGPKSQPYGIAVSNGLVWYSESGVRPNTLVSFDPGTQRFQTWAIPSGGGAVRHMVAAPDGSLGLALSGVNGVAHVTIGKH